MRHGVYFSSILYGAHVPSAADIYILWTSFLPEKLAAPSKPARFKANMLRMDSRGPLLYNMLYIYLLFYSGGGGGCLVYRVLTTEKGRGEGKQRECLCHLSWSVHHNLCREGYLESTCCCVQARFVGMKTKILFS